MKVKKKKPIPFDFVLEQISDLDPQIKPMFGSYGVYVGHKIIFILRDRESSPGDNGVWIATTSEHHKSLQKEFPNMRSIEVFGPGPTGWQNLPSSAADFEEAVMKACEMVLKKDVRIGKIPEKYRAKKQATATGSSKKGLAQKGSAKRGFN